VKAALTVVATNTSVWLPGPVMVVADERFAIKVRTPSLNVM